MHALICPAILCVLVGAFNPLTVKGFWDGASGKEPICQYNRGSSVKFSHSAVSDSLQTHGLKHLGPPCSSPTSRVYSNSCPSSGWCHPTISSSVIPFSSCPQSFSASESLPRSQLFTSGGQRIGISASTSVPLKNTQDWSPLGWTGWISLQSKGHSRVLQHHCRWWLQPWN